MSKKKKQAPPVASIPPSTPPSVPPAVPTPAPASRRDLAWFGGILLAALVLRLIYLGRADLWQDEMLLVMTANINLGVGEVFRNYWASQMVSLGWMPLPALVQNVFMSFVSAWIPDIMQNPFAARIPGVLFGVLGVAGVWKLAGRGYAPAVRTAATLVAAATFYPVFYAREVHAYPLLLALAPWALYYFTAALSGGVPRVLPKLFVFTLLLANAHLTAPMLVFAMAVVAGLCWMNRIKQGASSPEARRALGAVIAIALAGAAVIPVFMKILGGDSPHLKQASGVSPLFVLNDVVAKLFLGDWPVPAALGWLVVAAGVGMAIVRRRTAPEPALHAALLGLGGGLILLAALRTQYLSARYFAVVTPILMLFIVLGLFAIAGVVAAKILRKERLAIPLGWGLAGLFLAIHLMLFLPPMFVLKNKSTDFGSIARWLNQNLAEGTPYVMESAYELRFVSGFYPTPGLVPAAPYTHGNDPSEIDRLWERQEAFFGRFPEAALVESAFHLNKDGQRWEYPRKHFRQHVELRDDALRSLVRMGIYGTFFRKDLTDNSFVTWIHYNKPEDIRAALREQGKAALPVYQGWQVAALAPGTYARAFPGAVGQFMLENLAGAEVAGRLDVLASVYTDAPGEPVNATLRLGNQRYGPFSLRGGSITTLPLGEVVLPAAGAEVVWRIEADTRDKVKALLAFDAVFTPVASAK